MPRRGRGRKGLRRPLWRCFWLGARALTQYQYIYVFLYTQIYTDTLNSCILYMYTNPWIFIVYCKVILTHDISDNISIVPVFFFWKKYHKIDAARLMEDFYISAKKAGGIYPDAATYKWLGQTWWGLGSQKSYCKLGLFTKLTVVYGITVASILIGTCIYQPNM